MSLLDTLRSAVKIADKVTKPLQATVIYERLQTGDGYGAGTFGSPVLLRAIVDFKRVQVRTRAGLTTVTRATIDLLDIDAVVAATGGAGIGNDDKFTLPDGDTGPILDIGGFVDAGTTHPIATTVMLG
jgi:hypothetical protein